MIYLTIKKCLVLSVSMHRLYSFKKYIVRKYRNVLLVLFLWFTILFWAETFCKHWSWSIKIYFSRRMNFHRQKRNINLNGTFIVRFPQAMKHTHIFPNNRLLHECRLKLPFNSENTVWLLNTWIQMIA